MRNSKENYCGIISKKHKNLDKHCKEQLTKNTKQFDGNKTILHYSVAF